MRVLWSEEAEIALSIFYEEQVIITNDDIADARLDSITSSAETLIELPESGNPIIIDDTPTNDRLLSCFGGYLIYQIQEEIIYILLFIRTIELPDILKNYWGFNFI